MTWLILLAGAIALARGADWQLAVSPAMAWLVQACALVAWLHWRTGWLGLRANAACSRGDRVSTAAVLAVGAAIAVRRGSADLFWLACTAYLVGQLFVEWSSTWYHRIESLMDRPGRLCRAMVGPWVALVVVTTLLLSIPLATHPNVPDYRHNFWLHISNCAFTATSAACLVGTSIYSFGEDFTVFGQAVLMLATQFAGMALAAVGLSLARPFLSRDLRLRTVWGSAIAVQLVGAVAMAIGWNESNAATVSARAAWGIVHATSAIWNSGFTIQPNGLANYLGNPLIFTTATTLAIIGSLGLPVILDLVGIGAQNPASKIVSPLRRLASWEAGIAFMLLLAVAGLVFLFETPGFLPDGLVPNRPFELGTHQVAIRDESDHGSRWRTAVFVSATLRSAGLQSISLVQGAVSWPTCAVLVVGMMIGGSVGGVAGGFRTSAAALAAILTLYGRRAWKPPSVGAPVRRALLVAVLVFPPAWVAMNVAAIFALRATTAGSIHEWVLEAAAAMNGVGLSTGLSLHLTWAGRLVMIAAMIVGRWTPLLVWARLAGRMADAERGTRNAE